MAAGASSTSEIANDGPVLSVINKRLRALRKKLNRIAQMEESISQGKALNKEQEETLRSKPSVVAGIDELEKLRQPLSQAVNQEIQLALEKYKQSLETVPEERTDEKGTVDRDANGEDVVNWAVADLLALVYFGSIFDVQTLMRANDNMLTRTHERNCCLTYDYVTDEDAADPLKEWDLDFIAMMGNLLISRPVDSGSSHRDSLQRCVEHAKLWLANSEQPIWPNSIITYAGLRGKLNKIMASDYYTTSPQIKVPVEVAAAVGNYASFQVPVRGSVIPQVGFNVPAQGSAAEYEQRQEEEESTDSSGGEMHDDQPGPNEEVHKEGSEIASVSEHPAGTEPGELDMEVDQNSRDEDLREQQYSSGKPHQNYRGGRVRGGGGGGRRGYGNGRGGRGVNKGGYQNGRSQFFDQPGSYYPRNNYRGRGGRGIGGNYNYNAPTNHAGSVQAAS